MAVSYAAIGRSSGPRRVRETSSSSRFGRYISVADLVALHAAARDIGFLSRQRTQSVLSSRRHRGSNLPPTSGVFGPLMSGDLSGADHRRRFGRSAADVTAYDETPPRPIFIVVDQRQCMFYGSRRSLKSVAAAEAAALCIWRALDDGAPIGGVVFNDAIIEAVEPSTGSSAAMAIIKAIAGQNAELRARPAQPRAPSQLEKALRSERLEQASGSLIVVISDFQGHGAHTRAALQKLAEANEVVAVCAYDPYLLDLPKTGEIIVTGGEVQIDLEFGQGRIRRRLFDYADAQAQGLLTIEREIGVPVLSLSAAEDTSLQMRRLLDENVWRVRQ
ncbi:protein of unknown function DUF58 [Methylocella silvestris BL2]|uniref:DUF58 domain-containing protein n=2 Tax=Methylocella silvestris TaxID=199596 RepID=B8EQB3_METSB|nr:protein of unknown function DUF58 [Methylocella silvestris BL2]